MGLPVQYIAHDTLEVGQNRAAIQSIVLRVDNRRPPQRVRRDGAGDGIDCPNQRNAKAVPHSYPLSHVPKAIVGRLDLNHQIWNHLVESANLHIQRQFFRRR